MNSNIILNYIVSHNIKFLNWNIYFIFCIIKNYSHLFRFLGSASSDPTNQRNVPASLNPTNHSNLTDYPTAQEYSYSTDLHQKTIVYGMIHDISLYTRVIRPNILNTLQYNTIHTLHHTAIIYGILHRSSISTIYQVTPFNSTMASRIKFLPSTIVHLYSQEINEKISTQPHSKPLTSNISRYETSNQCLTNILPG